MNHKEGIEWDTSEQFARNQRRKEQTEYKKIYNDTMENRWSATLSGLW